MLALSKKLLKALKTDSKTLFLANLPADCTKDLIKSFSIFENATHIEFDYFDRDNAKGHKDYSKAFVTFSTEEEKQNALWLANDMTNMTYAPLHVKKPTGTDKKIKSRSIFTYEHDPYSMMVLRNVPLEFDTVEKLRSIHRVFEPAVEMMCMHRNPNILLREDEKAQQTEYSPNITVRFPDRQLKAAARNTSAIDKISINGRWLYVENYVPPYMAFIQRLQKKIKHYAYKRTKQESLLYRSKRKADITEMKTKSFKLKKTSKVVLK